MQYCHVGHLSRKVTRYQRIDHLHALSVLHGFARRGLALKKCRQRRRVIQIQEAHRMLLEIDEMREKEAETSPIQELTLAPTLVPGVSTKKPKKITKNQVVFVDTRFR